MTVTPHGVRIFAWVFFPAYMIIKITWYIEFTGILPEMQQFNPRSVTYQSLHILSALLTLATVTFRQSSLVRSTCIALTAFLIFVTVGLGATLTLGYPVPASNFAIHLMDSTMLVVAYMIAMNFKYLVR